MAATTVFINGRFLGQRLTGIQRYARETLLALDGLLYEELRGQHALAVVLLVPQGIAVPELKFVRTEELGPFNGHAWEQVSLPLRVGGELLLSFSATGPIFKRHQVVTVHDASVERVQDAFRPAFRHWYGIQIRRFGQRIRRVLTVTHFSAGEIQECFGVQAHRIRVTSEGWQHMMPAAAAASVVDRQWNDRPFVLAVSSPTPNKNFAAVANAALDPRMAGIDFLIAGARDSTVFQTVSAAPSPANVRFLGYVSDAELATLYDQAACFVFPSRYEGFGIPLIEAMSRGCPVVASDIPPSREVCGSAVRYFPLDDPLQMVSLIENIVSDPDEAAELRAKGRAAASRYSWRGAAELTWNAVQEVLAVKRQGQV